MTPRYTADSTIEISREADQVTNFQGVQREANAADQEFYQTQYGLLKSRSLAERVAAQLQLIDDPKFFALFGDKKHGPAFTLVAGRYPAAGRSLRQRECHQRHDCKVGYEATALDRGWPLRFQRMPRLRRRDAHR